MAITLGLTGTLGSGKTSAARMMAEMGARVVDADQLAREALEPGRPAYEETVAAFGRGILAPDGRIDRKALGRIVFADPEKRRRLEAIVHPKVRAEERRLAAEAGENDIVVFDVPLLFETGFDRECDRTCLVLIDEEKRIERLTKHGWKKEDIEARLRAQLPQAEKARRADFVIDNSGGLEAMRREAARILKELKSLAGRKRPPKE
ncbi:MAG: dephospho-CoA kinase [Candidatus Sumerlaeota bacterium]|nr:dephospho-CoA kinase [Candidatus Sumerlaeota bacterium]